jgi:hypothetical protein
MKENRDATLQLMADFLSISLSQAAKAYDTSIHSFTDDGQISDKGLMVNIQLTKERLKIVRDVPLNQVVDWSLVRELKAERRLYSTSTETKSLSDKIACRYPHPDRIGNTDGVV